LPTGPAPDLPWNRDDSDVSAVALGCGIAGLLGLATAAASASGSPLSPGWSEHSDLPSAVFLAASAAAFVLYALGLYLGRRRKTGLAAVCAVAAAVQLVPLAGPLLLSRDVYAYWAYGREVTRHDANPYAVAPARFAADPATRAMAGAWRAGHTVYGPAFSATSAGLAAATGRSAETSAFTYRLLGALGVLTAVALAALAAPASSFAAAFVGWNPLLALDFAGGGHNDVWMAVFVLAGIALTRRRPGLAGASWALAAGLKWVPLALLPFDLVRAGRREARRSTVGFLVCAVAIAGGALVLFGTAWLGALLPFAHRRSAYALPSRLGELGLPGWAAASLAAAPLAVALPWLVRSARRGRPRLGVTTILLLAASPWVLPWYAVWAVPLAAVEEDRLGWLLALGLCAYLLPDRVPI
jgi:Glycosyltransferase family 87